MSNKPDVPPRAGRSTLALNQTPDMDTIEQSAGYGIDDAGSITNQTRAQEVVHEPVHGEGWDRPWEPPSNLKAPTPRPGMSQRWVRTHIHGSDDVMNIEKSAREGWRPRRSDTVPQGFFPPTIQEGRFSGCIGVHGLVLCEMPSARLAQREKYYAELTRRQARAVEADLENQPIHQQRKSTMSRGRVPVVAGDVESDPD